MYIVTRFHEKYSWLLKKTLSDFTKQELFFSRNHMEGLSHHFSSWNIFPIPPYFLLLGVCEQKWKLLIVNPEHSEYEAVKTQTCHCGCGNCHVDGHQWTAARSLLVLHFKQKTCDQLLLHNKREHLKLYHKILGLEIEFNLKYVWDALFLLNLFMIYDIKWLKIKHFLRCQQ